MKGDSERLKALRLGMVMPVAKVIKSLGKVPPLAVLKLCYGTKKYDFPDCLLQHADDLDFVQDTLSATCCSLQLNPALNGVLAGFNRRRRFGRFKWGQQTLEFDRLRFGQTASEKDSDLFATEVVREKTNNKDKKAGEKWDDKSGGAICKFYQKPAGCYRRKCIYTHKCIICNRRGHGAVDCETIRRVSEREQNRRRVEERPPDPRMRRTRVQNQLES